jgi:hypothetical protein
MIVRSWRPWSDEEAICNIQRCDRLGEEEETIN